MTKTMIALLVGLMLAAPAVAEDEAGTKMTWYADFDKAVEVAKAEGKDLLVDFTGSDWCGWCKKLKQEVFVHQEFLDGVKEKFILVELDFPNDAELKKKVPNPERNAELRDSLPFNGYPTILLMTADGGVYAKTGYRPGGPAAYVTHLEEIGVAGKKTAEEAKVFATAWEKAEEGGKVAAVEKAIAGLQGLTDAVKLAREALMADQQNADLRKAFGEAQTKAAIAGHYIVPVVKHGLEVDPENKAGLKLKCVNALMKSGNADATLFDAAEKLDPKNENGLLEMVLAARFGTIKRGDLEGLKALLLKVDEFEKLGVVKDTDAGINLFRIAAICYAQHVPDPAKAAHYAQKLVDMGALEKDPRLKRLIDQILANAPKKDAPAEEPEKPAEEKPAEK